MIDISQNIQTLNIPYQVRLIAISKKKPAIAVKEAYNSGLREFGESFLQESIEKIKSLQSLDDIKWHFIGNIQSKKASKVAEFFDFVQSIDRTDIVAKINKKCEELNKIMPCLIQINIGREEQKSGIFPEKTLEFLEYCKTLKNIKIKGFMCIPPKEDSGKYFQIMKILFDTYRDQYNLPILSMGMSNDYIKAIKEGSNMVRIGTSIFGKRKIK